MRQASGRYIQVLNRNRLSDGTEVLHIDEMPPPYSTLETNDDDDWKEFFLDLQPMANLKGKFGITISGGIETKDGPSVFINHIEPCSSTSLENGRSQLKIFDEILSINGLELTGLYHDQVAQYFTQNHGQRIRLGIRRLEPRYVEHVDFLVPQHRLHEPLGLVLSGGLESESDDPGLFIKRIDHRGLLASITKPNQIRVGDRLLEVKTNYTASNLQRLSQTKGVELIRRTFQDHERITLVVAHQNS